MMHALDAPLPIPAGRSQRGYWVVKRLIDTSVAFVTLILLVPLLIIVAVAIRLDSRGPALFMQDRVGARRCADGWRLRPFRIVKFRSMVVDANPTIHAQQVRAYAGGELEGTTFKLTDDARITRIGRIIRRASIDELPQLLNVLRGEMSLVGPRPLPWYEVEQYPEDGLVRFAALPGLTGLWQVSGRCTLPYGAMVALDAAYVEQQSLGLDLKILLKTIPAVLSGRGAG
jgi:lipopolysaccharide/colanic/teichoic acid biosynthesis glycosyltransferase